MTDHLPTSDCLHSFWMPPKLIVVEKVFPQNLQLCKWFSPEWSDDTYYEIISNSLHIEISTANILGW